MPDAGLDGFNARQTRYRLDTEIGHGGMSAVYRGGDLVLDRRVAVKVFRASAADNEELRAQQRESRLLASFAHHSLVRLFDVGVDVLPDGSPRIFLVMELVDGSDLRVRLRHGPLPIGHIAHIAYDLAEGLAYLHAHGVTHRDLKPANVLLVSGAEGRRPRVKLADFGIARVEGQPGEAEQDVTGTAAYLSPEQAAGEPVSESADVYALGLVILEAITRTIEFPGGIIESAFARLSRDPVIPDHLPAEWVAILRSMTRRRPEDRPSAPQAAESFRRILVGEFSRERGEGADDAVGRIGAVRRYNVLAVGDDPELDQICALAVRLTRADGAVIAIADEDRALVRARAGVVSGVAARRRYVDGVLEGEPVWIEDLRATAPQRALPLLGQDADPGSYASAPLTTHDGHGIGVLALLGRGPWPRDERDAATLQDLADMAMHEIELRRAVRRILLPGAQRSTE